MKQRAAAITILSLAVAVICGSCIFQNDPKKPNNPPVLQSYFPLWTHNSMILPDSCWFCITAIDPDGDLLSYRFSVGDSVMGTCDSAVFYGCEEGEYVIEGRASDGNDHVSRTWVVAVNRKPNAPPVIDRRYPEQEHVECIVGEILEFHFSVTDDYPDALIYSFLVDSHEILSAQPDLVHRFLESRMHILQGAAWDGEFGDTVTWFVEATGDPDTIAPAAIGDLAGEVGAEPGTIYLTWTAPGDDGASGTAAAYLLRTSACPIETEDDWDAASDATGEPVPSPSGTEEVMIAGDLSPGAYLYAMMRAADDFANLSPLGNSVMVFARGTGPDGYVVDLWSNDPVAGIRVSSLGISNVTNEDGYFWLQNLPYIDLFNACDELESNTIGDYYDCTIRMSSTNYNPRLNLYIIRHLELVNVVRPETYQGSFLAFFKEMTETSGWIGRPTVDKTWNHYPITVYNPPRSCGDVDCRRAARGAMTEWENATGLDLFREAGERASADVEIVYVDTLIDRHQVSTPACNPDGTPAKKVIWIYSGYAGVPITVYPHLIFVHELGHVLCLDHSRDAGHVMVELTMPSVHHVTEDEANVVRIIYHAPSIYDYATILDE